MKMSDIKGKRYFCGIGEVVGHGHGHGLNDKKPHVYLNGWWCDLHTQDDVSHFALSQGTNIHIVLLAIVSEDEILQGNFDANPLLIWSIV